MAQVNLLPWREQARQKQKQKFYTTIGLFVFLTLILAALIHFFLSNLISNQNARNTFLQTEIAQNQTSYTQLQKTQEAQTETINKIQFLINLQINNFKIIQLLNELPHLIPSNISLIGVLSENMNSVTIQGKAASSFDITNLVKNLSQSKLFGQPQLTKITAQENAPERKVFELKVETKK